MFIIGMELDLTKLKHKKHNALLISQISIMVPFFLGILLSYFIYDQYAPESITFVSFALFIGISMSITAFPVLARVVQERKLTNTTLGVLAITCAAADDVTAWCLLAVVIAIVKAGNIYSALYTIALTLAFVMIMIYVIKPLLARINSKYLNPTTLKKSTVAIAFFVLLVSAFSAEIIGIHSLFGAFIAGVIMPNNINFKKTLSSRIEDISLIILLPIFFAFTGLRTQIGLLNQGHLWTLCGYIILIAVSGKLLSSAFTAKLLKFSWKDSLSLGVLLNTRGLMELIVLNIGYDIGVLTPEIFAILVLMALSTTFMTGPLLDLINYLFPKRFRRKASNFSEE